MWASWQMVIWRRRLRIRGMGWEGKQYHFHVTHLAWYPPPQAPLQEIFGVAGGTYLNLITCAGTWIPREHQTTRRIVVYTTLDV